MIFEVNLVLMDILLKYQSEIILAIVIKVVNIYRNLAPGDQSFMLSYVAGL